MDTLRGWVYIVRDIGKLKFVLVRIFPENRVVQTVFKEGETEKSSMKLVESLYPETLLELKGEWRSSEKAPGGREFVVKEASMISPSKPLPIDISGKTPVEYANRIKYRWLDVRRPEVSAVLRLKSIILKAARDYLLSEGFVETTYPVIISTASEGGAELFPVVYFDKEAFLAQSGQLYKQALVPSLGKVFSISASFRAEKSRTRKHLTEFWQIDVEAGFVTERDLMDIEFGIYRSVTEELNKYPELFEILGREPPEIPRTYEDITYDEALEILRGDGVDIAWGDDFGAPEERKLCSHFDTPFFIRRFPLEQSPFYAKVVREDPKYSYKMDFMAPGENGMELSSGGLREENPEMLRKRMKELGLKPESFEWYVEMFEYGFPPHGGFGIGIERLTTVMLGLEKVTDATAFPRTPDILYP